MKLEIVNDQLLSTILLFYCLTEIKYNFVKLSSHIEQK